MSNAFDQFLSSYTGVSDTPPEDPQARLISKDKLGVRPWYKRTFIGISLASSVCLVVTLAENIPTLRNLIALIYVVAIVGLAMFDIASSTHKYGRVDRSQVYLIVTCYAFISLAVAALFLLILSV